MIEMNCNGKLFFFAYQVIVARATKTTLVVPQESQGSPRTDIELACIEYTTERTICGLYVPTGTKVAWPVSLLITGRPSLSLGRT